MKTTISIFVALAMSAFGSVAQAHDHGHHSSHHSSYHSGHHSSYHVYHGGVGYNYGGPACGPYYYGRPGYYYSQPYYYPGPGVVLRLGW